MSLYTYQAPIKKIAVSLDSWHFRYFLWIRSLWGAFDVPEKKSLCPYVQTIICGSLVAVIFSPVILMAWGFYKFVEYAAESDNNTFSGIFGWYADNIGIDKENLTPEMKKRIRKIGYVPSMIMLGMVVIAVCFGVAAGIYCLGIGIWNISDIGAFFWICILYAGWGIFECCAGLIWFFQAVWTEVIIAGGLAFWDALKSIGASTSYLFSWLGSWSFSWDFWKPVLKWLGIVVGSATTIGGSAVGIGYVVMRIGKSAVIQAIATAIGDANMRRSKKNRQRRALRSQRHAFKSEQKAYRVEKRAIEYGVRLDKKRHARAIQEKERLKWKCRYCKYKNDSHWEICENCDTAKPISLWKSAISPFTLIAKLFGFLFGWARTRVIRIGNVKVHVIGAGGLFWEFAKAIKYRACPMVDFVTDAQLQSQAESAAVQLKMQKDKSAAEREARIAKWAAEQRSFVRPSKPSKPFVIDKSKRS